MGLVDYVTSQSINRPHPLVAKETSRKTELAHAGDGHGGVWRESSREFCPQLAGGGAEDGVQSLQHSSSVGC